MSVELRRPTPKAGVLDIEAYQPGKSRAPDGVELFKLSSNETPLGPSEKARTAAMQAAASLELYPDGQSSALKAAIANAHDLDAKRILVGNGSDELLGLLAQAFLSPGDEAIHTEHGFLVYDIYIRAAGASPVVARETAERADVDAILACVGEKTKIVFLANPNNPTGTYLPFTEVRRLHAALPPHVLLVLDAAYAEYVREGDYEAGVSLVSEFENVVMTRTFSKIHGLAALRIGWMLATAAVVDALDRIRGPFNVNATWLVRLSAELTKLGLRVTPSVGNFLLVHFPETPGKGAAEADAFLTARGFILRRVTGYGFPNALRLTVGTERANIGVAAALAKFLDPGAPA